MESDKSDITELSDKLDGLNEKSFSTSQPADSTNSSSCLPNARSSSPGEALGASASEPATSLPTATPASNPTIHQDDDLASQLSLAFPSLGRDTIQDVLRSQGGHPDNSVAVLLMLNGDESSAESVGL